MDNTNKKLLYKYFLCCFTNNDSPVNKNTETTGQGANHPSSAEEELSKNRSRSHSSDFRVYNTDTPNVNTDTNIDSYRIKNIVKPNSSGSPLATPVNSFRIFTNS